MGMLVRDQADMEYNEVLHRRGSKRYYRRPAGAQCHTCGTPLKRRVHPKEEFRFCRDCAPAIHGRALQVDREARRWYGNTHTSARSGRPLSNSGSSDILPAHGNEAADG